MLRYLFILPFLFSSCQGIFQDTDDNLHTLDTWQDKIDLLNGIYAMLVDVHDEHYLWALCRSDDVNVYGNMKSNSQAEESSKQGTSTCSYTGIINPDYNVEPIRVYRLLYSAVLNANKLISVRNSSEYDLILGEAYFLRAYCYFKLVRIFGSTPLITDINVNNPTPKPTFEAIYSQIVSDLEIAIAYLPTEAIESRNAFESPTQFAAKALLAEVYLNMAGYPLNNFSNYERAAKLAVEVIQAEEYGLLPDMQNLWSEDHRHNAENIFGLFHLPAAYEEGSEISDIPTNRFGHVYIEKVNEKEGHSLKFNSFYKPELAFYANFPDNYRKQVSFNVQSLLLSRNGHVIFDTTSKKYNSLTEPCNYLENIAILKWYDLNQLRLPGSNKELYTQSRTTLYLLRYAQTLLTYAEAKVRIGEMDATAYEAVNMVRRRANRLDIYSPSEFDLTPDLSQQQLIDSIVWERAWELCGEPDGRWFDIVRLDLKDDLKSYRFPYDKPTNVAPELLSTEWYFYLIPEEDRKLNPNFN